MISRARILGTIAAVLGLSVGISARATVIERVVAVVGEHAILLSDVRQRAKPFLLQIHQRVPNPAQEAAAESEMFKQLLDRMVDERIEQQAAEKSHISVSSEEIDNGIRNVANQQHLTVEQLLAEAGKTGLTVQEYRDEVRRQILEGKLLQLRVKGRIRVTDDDVKKTYAKLARAERARLGYRLAWIALQVPAGSSPETRASKELLSRSIVATARAGVDLQGRPVEFASLAKSFSEDANSRLKGGDLGMRKSGELAQAVEDQALRLEVGGVSNPFTFKDAIVIVKVLEREPSQLPALAEARDEVMQRVYGEQMDKARRDWLEELRRGLYVDVRL